METILPLENLIYFDSLPVLKSSAIDQILEESTNTSCSSASTTSSSSSSASEMERMSPDSSMDWRQQHQQQPLQQQQQQQQQPHSPQQQPDSTTNSDGCNNVSNAYVNSSSSNLDPGYDSDAFNSDDSNQSMEFVPTSADNNNTSDKSKSLKLKTKKKKKKKSKRAGDVLLQCQLCEYSTRYKEHLTSHMITHKSDRDHMCSDCGQVRERT